MWSTTLCVVELPEESSCEQGCPQTTHDCEQQKTTRFLSKGQEDGVSGWLVATVRWLGPWSGLRRPFAQVR